MVTIRFQPLSKWPYPEPESGWRKYAQFKTVYVATLNQLQVELDRIEAENRVLELDFPRGAIEQSGLPKLNQKPRSDRVRLSFVHPKIGFLEYPCDTFYGYENNVRAIVLTLEAQRAMARYGAVKDDQQYRGWKQELPPPESILGQVWTLDEAAELVATLANQNKKDATALLESEGFYRFCYREAAKAAHPDSGGSEASFKRLQSARDLLEEHFRTAVNQ
jgi:hypothetical protein